MHFMGINFRKHFKVNTVGIFIKAESWIYMYKRLTCFYTADAKRL